VSSAILRGYVTLRLNFRLKGHVLRQYLWTVISGNLSKSALFEGVGHFDECKFQTEGGVTHQPLLMSQKLE